MAIEKNSGLRTKIMALVICTLCTMISVIIYNYTMKNTYTTIIFDSKASVSFEMNKYDEVIKINGINEQGKELLSKVDTKDKNIKRLIDNILSISIDENHIGREDNTVLFSYLFYKNNENIALLNQLEKIAYLQLHDSKINGRIISQVVDIYGPYVKVADGYQISAGKLALISKYMDDADMTREDMSRCSITEIASYMTNYTMSNLAIETSTNNSNILTPENAKKIAIESAGLKESDILKDKIELENEYGRQIYEVKLYTSNMEYEYDMDAITGEILGYSFENINKRNSMVNPSTNDAIKPKEEVQQIVYNHAKVKPEQVIRYHIGFDYENGKFVYEIEFETPENEYEYKIDSVTGQIIKSEVARNN